MYEIARVKLKPRLLVLESMVNMTVYEMIRADTTSLLCGKIINVKE